MQGEVAAMRGFQLAWFHMNTPYVSIGTGPLRGGGASSPCHAGICTKRTCFRRHKHNNNNNNNNKNNSNKNNNNNNKNKNKYNSKYTFQSEN
jgi:hypothetical protein